MTPAKRPAWFKAVGLAAVRRADGMSIILEFKGPSINHVVSKIGNFCRLFLIVVFSIKQGLCSKLSLGLSTRLPNKTYRVGTICFFFGGQG